MQNDNNLIPITEAVPTDKSTWCYLRYLVRENVKLYSYQDKIDVSTHISNANMGDYQYLHSILLEGSSDEELIQRKHEKSQDHLERLKSAYLFKFGSGLDLTVGGDYFEIYSDTFITQFVKMNRSFIPKGTPHTFIYEVESYFGDDGYTMAGKCPNDLYINQVFIKEDFQDYPLNRSSEFTKVNKNNNGWSVSSDYSLLTSPDFNIKASSINSRKILKALLEIHKENNGDHFQSNEVFHKAELSIYQMKLAQFIRKNPSFGKILKYHESSKSYTLTIPIFT
jgi:hypothetical protein